MDLRESEIRGLNIFDLKALLSFKVDVIRQDIILNGNQKEQRSNVPRAAKYLVPLPKVADFAKTIS